ncbi:MAG: hypothetical protein HYV02_07050 [Deltaproteobacteria bacterium]|nr:hypothetical protein [Deltaproteobacteria bacterium]
MTQWQASATQVSSKGPPQIPVSGTPEVWDRPIAIAELDRCIAMFDQGECSPLDPDGEVLVTLRAMQHQLTIETDPDEIARLIERTAVVKEGLEQWHTLEAQLEASLQDSARVQSIRRAYAQQLRSGDVPQLREVLRRGTRLLADLHLMTRAEAAHKLLVAASNDMVQSDTVPLQVEYSPESGLIMGESYLGDNATLSPARLNRNALTRTYRMLANSDDPAHRALATSLRAAVGYFRSREAIGLLDAQSAERRTLRAALQRHLRTIEQALPYIEQKEVAEAPADVVPSATAKDSLAMQHALLRDRAQQLYAALNTLKKELAVQGAGWNLGQGDANISLALVDQLISETRGLLQGVHCQGIWVPGLESRTVSPDVLIQHASRFAHLVESRGYATARHRLEELGYYMGIRDMIYEGTILAPLGLVGAAVARARALTWVAKMGLEGTRAGGAIVLLAESSGLTIGSLVGEQAFVLGEPLPAGLWETTEYLAKRVLLGMGMLKTFHTVMGALGPRIQQVAMRTAIATLRRRGISLQHLLTNEGQALLARELQTSFRIALQNVGIRMAGSYAGFTGWDFVAVNIEQGLDGQFAPDAAAAQVCSVKALVHRAVMVPAFELYGGITQMRQARQLTTAWNQYLAEHTDVASEYRRVQTDVTDAAEAFGALLRDTKGGMDADPAHVKACKDRMRQTLRQALTFYESLPETFRGEATTIRERLHRAEYVEGEIAKIVTVIGPHNVHGVIEYAAGRFTYDVTREAQLITALEQSGARVTQGRDGILIVNDAIYLAPNVVHEGPIVRARREMEAIQRVLPVAIATPFSRGVPADSAGGRQAHTPGTGRRTRSSVSGVKQPTARIVRRDEVASPGITESTRREPAEAGGGGHGADALQHLHARLWDWARLHGDEADYRTEFVQLRREIEHLQQDGVGDPQHIRSRLDILSDELGCEPPVTSPPAAEAAQPVEPARADPRDPRTAEPRSIVDAIEAAEAGLCELIGGTLFIVVEAGKVITVADLLQTVPLQGLRRIEIELPEGEAITADTTLRMQSFQDAGIDVVVRGGEAVPPSVAVATASVADHDAQNVTAAVPVPTVEPKGQGHVPSHGEDPASAPDRQVAVTIPQPTAAAAEKRARAIFRDQPKILQVIVWRSNGRKSLFTRDAPRSGVAETGEASKPAAVQLQSTVTAALRPSRNASVWPEKIRSAMCNALGSLSGREWNPQQLEQSERSEDARLVRNSLIAEGDLLALAGRRTADGRRTVEGRNTLKLLALFATSKTPATAWMWVRALANMARRTGQAHVFDAIVSETLELYRRARANGVALRGSVVESVAKTHETVVRDLKYPPHKVSEMRQSAQGELAVVRGLLAHSNHVAVVDVLPRSGTGHNTTPDLRIVFRGASPWTELWDVKTSRVGHHRIDYGQFASGLYANIDGSRVILLGGGLSTEVIGEIRQPRRGFRIHHFPDLAPSPADFRRIATPTPAREGGSR